MALTLEKQFTSVEQGSGFRQKSSDAIDGILANFATTPG